MSIPDSRIERHGYREFSCPSIGRCRTHEETRFLRENGFLAVCCLPNKPPRTAASAVTCEFWIPVSSEIYVRRWDGTAWREVGTGSATGGGVSNKTGLSVQPSVAVGADGNPIVAWVDGWEPSVGVAAWAVHVRRWDGAAWSEMGAGSATGGGVSGTSARGTGLYPSLAIGRDGNPVVAWHDDSSGDTEIYVRRWNGTAWVEMGANSASAGGISNNSGQSSSPSLAVGPDGRPLVAWEDGTGGDLEIYVRRWDGSAWATMSARSASGGGISNNTSHSMGPSVAFGHDGNPIVAWSDVGEILVRRWNGTAWAEMGTGSASQTGISKNDGWSTGPATVVGLDGTPIVAWSDATGGDSEVYVRRYMPTFALQDFATGHAISVGSPLSIGYSASGWAGPVDMTLYYDTDTDPSSGLTQIWSGQVTNGAGTYAWAVPWALHDQQLYLYARATDGTTTVADYVVSPVTVTKNVVLVVPDILGSWPMDRLDSWFQFGSHGTAPENLALDPFGNTYRNLVAVLQATGDGQAVKVFEAPYDWRRSVDGPSGVEAVDIARPDTGVEYLVYWLNQAADWWTNTAGYDARYFTVDIVAHGMGGVVARELIQRFWYGELASRQDLAIRTTDPVDTLVMLDTPNHGAVDAYLWQTWLNQIPAVAAKGAAALAQYAGLAAGVPPVLAAAATYGLSRTTDLSAADYVAAFSAGLQDLFPDWSRYDQTGTPAWSSCLGRLNHPNRGGYRLAENATVWNFTGHWPNAASSTTFKSVTVSGYTWAGQDVALNPLALRRQATYGTGMVVYPYGSDPSTLASSGINSYGAYLGSSEVPGVHNGVTGLAGFDGQATNGLFTTFASHRLFVDDLNVLKGVLAAIGLPTPAQKPHATDTTPGVLDAVPGLAQDWQQRKNDGVATLEQVIAEGWGPLTSWTISWDPANVVVTDGLGRRVGSDGAQTFSEIPGAAYLADGELGLIVLPRQTQSNAYDNVTVDAHGTGEYFEAQATSTDSSLANTQTLGGGVIEEG
ncbi:MAG: hypothetical protein FJ279_17930, partial [Planctomycetes bacterium]|nr:hypothetical protein [Planctomycetota bacterium]